MEINIKSITSSPAPDHSRLHVTSGYSPRFRSVCARYTPGVCCTDAEHLLTERSRFKINPLLQFDILFFFT